MWWLLSDLPQCVLLLDMVAFQIYEFLQGMNYLDAAFHKQVGCFGEWKLVRECIFVHSAGSLGSLSYHQPWYTSDLLLLDGSWSYNYILFLLFLKA